MVDATRLRLLGLLDPLISELERFIAARGIPDADGVFPDPPEDAAGYPLNSNDVKEVIECLAALNLHPAAKRLRTEHDKFFNAAMNVGFCEACRGQPAEYEEQLADMVGPFPAPLPDDAAHEEAQRERQTGVTLKARLMVDLLRGLRSDLKVEETRPGESTTPRDSTPEKRTEADSPHAHADRLKPSHRKAKALYEWAIENIPGAEDMTYADIFEALRREPQCGGEGLPDNAGTFARYCRAAGIRCNTPRRAKGPTRSVRWASDL